MFVYSNLKVALFDRNEPTVRLIQPSENLLVIQNHISGALRDWSGRLPF